MHWKIKIYWKRLSTQNMLLDGHCGKKKILRVDFIYSHVPASTWVLSCHHQLPSAAKTMDVELNWEHQLSVGLSANGCLCPLQQKKINSADSHRHLCDLQCKISSDRRWLEENFQFKPLSHVLFKVAKSCRGLQKQGIKLDFEVQTNLCRATVWE